MALCTLKTPCQQRFLAHCTTQKVHCQGRTVGDIERRTLLAANHRVRGLFFAIPVAQSDTSYGRGFWNLTHSYHAAGGRPTRTGETALADQPLCGTIGNRGINPFVYEFLRL